MTNKSIFIDLNEAVTAAQADGKIDVEFVKEIARSVLTHLNGFDLLGIFDPQYENKRVGANKQWLFDTIKSPEQILPYTLALATTVDVMEAGEGIYSVQYSNTHRLSKSITLRNNDVINPYKLVALHNLFRMVEGLPLQLMAQTPDLESRFTENKLEFVNKHLPYFQLKQQTNKCRYTVKFTRPELVDKINELLARDDFHLGQIVCSVLEKSFGSYTYPQKFMAKLKERSLSI